MPMTFIQTRKNDAFVFDHLNYGIVGVVFGVGSKIQPTPEFIQKGS